MSFPWQRDDGMVVNNFLTTHACKPYGDDRRILAAMSDL